MSSNRDMDALMVDWLYGELEPADAQRFEEYLEASEEAREQAEALKRTRAAFRDLDEEEPPTSISAILLHEAALRAPAERGEDGSRRGFWAWLSGLFQPLAAHPAAAAVATLVVVAGVAGTLYVHGKHKVAQPDHPHPEAVVASEASNEATRADDKAVVGGQAAEAPAPEAEPTVAISGEGYNADLADVETEAALDELAQDQGSRGRAESKSAALPTEGDRSTARPTGSLAKNDKPRKKSRRKSAERRPGQGRARDKAPLANAVTGADPLVDLDDDLGSYAADEESAGLGGAKNRAAPAYRPYKDERAKRDRAWARSQARELQQAVKEKDCREAAKIANDILDRNPDYYVERVKDSKDVEGCKWYVSQERQRRASRRRAQKASATKKRKAAGSSKAKAAPAADSAEAESTKQAH